MASIVIYGLIEPNRALSPTRWRYQS